MVVTLIFINRNPKVLSMFIQIKSIMIEFGDIYSILKIKNNKLHEKELVKNDNNFISLIICTKS